MMQNEICILEGIGFETEMNPHKNLVARTKFNLLAIQEIKMYNVTASVYKETCFYYLLMQANCPVCKYASRILVE